MASKLGDFLNHQHFLGEGTIRQYGYAIKRFNETAGCSFETIYLDEAKVHSVLGSLNKKLSASTWNTSLAMYKRYAKWLFDPEDEIAPKFWRKIKKKKIDWGKKLKDKWITEEQFHKLLDKIDNFRDKALFCVAVEGALRRGELLGLKIGDCKQTIFGNTVGYDVTVSGKTGSASFPVVLFAPLLTQWLAHHPLKHDGSAPLWVSKDDSNGWVALSKSGLAWTVSKYANRAGLPKEFSLHWLRHTKITWTAKNNEVRISDEMAKKMFRWSKSSSMFSRYTHLHGTDSSNAFLALAGVKRSKAKTKSKILEPKKCLNCQELNSATMLYCGKCGFILSEEEAKKLVEQKKLNDAFIKLSLERLRMDKELAKIKKKKEKERQK